MKLTLRHFDLPLRHPFTIARGTTTVQPTLVVELADGGLRGFGEATASRYYGCTIDNMTAALEHMRGKIESCRLDAAHDPAAMWSQLAPEFSNSFALSALDTAAHDLWGKKLGQRVQRLWGLTLDRLPDSSFTIGIDTIDAMLAKLAEAADWPIIKIKLGTPDDLEIVRALREHTAVLFRVDANCGWSPEETIANSRELKKLGVEFIEQPLPAACWGEMREVHRQAALPIFADESCRVEADVARCAEHFHGVNIKLVKCGGLTPARRMIDQARRAGLNVMVGCMTESTIGISAAAQLLPLVDYADIDGAALLARDIAHGVEVRHGRAVFPERSGCGVELR